ncbi:hypothetical protein DL95DRAFT_504112 [Leptodontidium sp. 2 PMI_412]|nr:hypothetical protein DL95DRAFT_504112 [Leptodontidium sp. 2 PMI_412]
MPAPSSSPTITPGPTSTPLETTSIPTRTSGSVTVETIESAASAFDGLGSAFSVFSSAVSSSGATDSSVAAAGSGLFNMFTSAFSAAADVGSSLESIGLLELDESGKLLDMFQETEIDIFELGTVIKDVEPLLKSTLNLVNGKKILGYSGQLPVALALELLYERLWNWRRSHHLTSQHPSQQPLPLKIRPPVQNPRPQRRLLLARRKRLSYTVSRLYQAPRQANTKSSSTHSQMLGKDFESTTRPSTTSIPSRSRSCVIDMVIATDSRQRGPIPRPGYSKKNGLYGYPEEPWLSRRDMLRDLLEQCWANDIVTVIAAGNEGTDSSFGLHEDVPACLGILDNALITVGACNAEGDRTPDTTRDLRRGGQILASAQGDGGFSSASADGSGTRLGTGTSFATPQIAGLAAYFMSLDRNELSVNSKGQFSQGQFIGPDLHIKVQVSKDVRNYIHNKMSYKRYPDHPNAVNVAYNGAEDKLCNLVPGTSLNGSEEVFKPELTSMV